VRTTQVLLLVLGAGAALSALGDATGLVLAASAIGFAMGCSNPALSAILGRHAPLDSAGFFFSLRVAAVPVGVAAAGLVLPVALPWVGWRASVWTACAICVAASLAAARAVRALEWRAGAQPAGPVLGAALSRVLRDPALRRLTLVSAVYSMAQQAFLAYSVLLLVRLGVPLPVAAGWLAGSQLVCVVTRIVAGLAADRWMPPRHLLGVYGICMSLSSLLLAGLPQSPSLLLVGVAMVACATTMMGWYGLVFAQMLRIVQREELAECTGGVQIFAFAGAMLGPYLFSLILGLGVSYPAAYGAVAVLTALAATGLFVHAPSAAAERAASQSA
jgi:MFS family permease